MVEWSSDLCFARINFFGLIRFKWSNFKKSSAYTIDGLWSFSATLRPLSEPRKSWKVHYPYEKFLSRSTVMLSSGWCNLTWENAPLLSGSPTAISRSSYSHWVSCGRFAISEDVMKIGSLKPLEKIGGTWLLVTLSRSKRICNGERNKQPLYGKHFTWLVIVLYFSPNSLKVGL